MGIFPLVRWGIPRILVRLQATNDLTGLEIDQENTRASLPARSLQADGDQVTVQLAHVRQAAGLGHRQGNVADRRPLLSREARDALGDGRHQR